MSNGVVFVVIRIGERLKSNAKHTTQAQIAVMRKIIIVAHSLYKNDTKYVKTVDTLEVETME